MSSCCEECRYCRWETSGNGWDEPMESIPAECLAGHNDNLDCIYREEECKDFEWNEGDDETGPDPMDAYKQKIEDDMLDKMEGRW